MIKLKHLFSVLSLFGISICTGQPQAGMDRFVDSLLARMTLEEKIGQLNLPGAGDIITGQGESDISPRRFERGEIGGLLNLRGVERVRNLQRVSVEKSRLGIPLLIGVDVIHGYETVFPIPLALSCTWDIPAIEKTARIAATEASADGVNWTLSPMVDICRDARWGRVAEGSGEDPWLGAEIARAMVRGYQGDLTRNDEILACVKHFALYGAAEAGRDYNSVKGIFRGKNMVEKYLIEWCSSTLASLKTASLFNWHYVHDNITLEQVKSSIDEMNEKFKEKGIQIEILREEETWALIYVYRVKKLEEDLKKNEVSKFLRENGYKETCVNYAISLLKKRLMDLKAFPHEIGVFLGYPIEDVIGFINNKGCNFKCCGYWKVYGDKEKAIKEFARYDKCRMIYTKLWNQGRSILKLTVAA